MLSQSSPSPVLGLGNDDNDAVVMKTMETLEDFECNR